MRKNSLEFRGFLTDDVFIDFEEYLEEMSTSSTWGDNLCIKAMADLFPEITVFIWDGEKQRWLNQLFGEGTQFVFWEFTGIHYNVLEMDQEKTNVDSVLEAIGHQCLLVVTSSFSPTFLLLMIFFLPFVLACVVSFFRSRRKECVKLANVLYCKSTLLWSLSKKRFA